MAVSIRTEPIRRYLLSSHLFLDNAARFPQESYYGGRPNSFMPPNNQFDGRQGTPGRDSYIDQQQGGYNTYHNGPANGRQRYSRMASEPQVHTAYRQAEQNIYPLPSNHRSYETVASGSGSGGSGEPAGYQTDPTSSDNSSIDRVQSPPKRQNEPTNDYGIGFSPTPTYQPSAFTVGINGGMNPGGPPQRRPAPSQNGPPAAPPVPRKDNIILRKPSRTAADDQSQQRPGMGEKRKSWFARRFSKLG